MVIFLLTLFFCFFLPVPLACPCFGICNKTYAPFIFVSLLLIYIKYLLDDTDLSITPTNTPVSPPIDIPVKIVNPLDAHMLRNLKTHDFIPLAEKTNLSPISGSLDLDSPSPSPLTFGKALINSGSNEKLKSAGATIELPLTEVNLALFTSEFRNRHSCKTSSTNELPLSDIKFKSRSCKLSREDTLDSQNDDTSLEVNWDTDIRNVDNKMQKKTMIQHRSFSDPSIMDNEWISSSDKQFLLQKYNESLNREHSPNTLYPAKPSLVPYSFYPQHQANTRCLLCVPRVPSNLLAFFSSRRSLSHPANPRVIDPCVSYSECGQAIKRHRHSIAGQMSYFKVMGLTYGVPGLKKLVAGSTNSLFSTAVISGSSSAPNLRDMIPNTASASGESYVSIERVEQSTDKNY